MIKNSLNIIIVNWNSGFNLEKYINSIFKRENKSFSKVIIVDNNSYDNSLEFLNIRIESKLKLVLNKENFGFTKAKFYSLFVETLYRFIYL